MPQHAMDRKARRVSHLLIALSLLCVLNYAVRLFPVSFGTCPADTPVAACAWAEFTLILLIQVGISLLLVLFIVAREIVVWFRAGRNATRLTPFTCVMLPIVPLTVLWFLHALATTATTGPSFVAGTRGAGLPLEFLLLILAFLQLGALCVALAWTLDRRQIRSREELRNLTREPHA